MLIIRIQILFLALLFISGCSDGSETTDTPVPYKKDTAIKEFFPVTDYIKGQLAEIDSLPITPVKVISSGGKEDSIWMKREDIRKFAAPFISEEIDSAHLYDLFNSASFLDQTINAFTFSFDPVGKLPDTMALRRWDVYVDPEKETIKRIYIVKNIGDNTVQLTWTNDWCKITIITEGTVKAVTEEKMIWNFK